MTDPTSADDLAAAQRALVAALVHGAADPAGFDQSRLAVARAALLRKRAGEVARHWPLLAAALGPRWPADFVTWAAARSPDGGWRDGWDFARALADAGALPRLAAGELAEREAGWRYDGRSAPRTRRLPALRRVPGGLVVQIAGQVRRLGRS
ncbi:hypothetical protein O7632_15840 [Solwaraspora sp. WMMD406]|uniref:hypothetical protein n=1 Tax=Solwaraspora sp. WMMD406 TaxID=3016095 RepID=UPI002416F419|nr:hypothetical protein [Solwaraspora sp. WMMD406]MDG4765557.1 hypothetical protein [Solwaraspora sp. WMMD406]